MIGYPVSLKLHQLQIVSTHSVSSQTNHTLLTSFTAFPFIDLSATDFFLVLEVEVGTRTSLKKYS